MDLHHTFHSRTSQYRWRVQHLEIHNRLVLFKLPSHNNSIRVTLWSMRNSHIRQSINLLHPPKAIKQTIHLCLIWWEGARKKRLCTYLRTKNWGRETVLKNFQGLLLKKRQQCREDIILKGVRLSNESSRWLRYMKHREISTRCNSPLNSSLSTNRSHP